MRAIRCDFCNRVIDENEEVYYTIDEITFNNPKSKRHYRMYSENSGNREETHNEESWVTYSNIDICHTCWWTDKLKALREIIQKRIGNGD